MKHGKYTSLLLLLTVLILFSQSSFAATVQGNAIKEGETDHSGMMVTLTNTAETPSLGTTGIILLLVSLGVLLVIEIEE